MKWMLFRHETMNEAQEEVTRWQINFRHHAIYGDKRRHKLRKKLCVRFGGIVGWYAIVGRVRCKGIRADGLFLETMNETSD